MYPKVKVRQEEEDDHHPSEFQRIFLKDFKSLSFYDHPSNSNPNSKSPERKHGYTPPHVRVPISGSGVKTSTTTSKVNKNIAEVNTKPASVLLPPRAVLSSPENDAMLRTKNITKTDQNHQNTHNKCKKSYQLDKRRKTKISWK